MKKKYIFIGLAILLLLGGLALYIFCVSGSNSTFDPPGTTTLNMGTQTRYNDLSIGLNSIENDSAWLSFNNNATKVSSNKQVKAGDTIDVDGYTLKVNSVKEIKNPSILPGSSHGYVKFVVNKR